MISATVYSLYHPSAVILGRERYMFVLDLLALYICLTAMPYIATAKIKDRRRDSIVERPRLFVV